MKLPAHLQQKAALIEQKRGEMAEIFSSNKDEKGALKLSQGQIKEINDREGELKTLTEAFAEEKGLHDIESKNSDALTESGQPARGMEFNGSKGRDQADRAAEAKSLGQLWVASKAYQERGKRAVKEQEVAGVDVKTAMVTNLSTGAGYAPQVLRSGVVIYSPQPQPTLIDLLPQTTTEQNGYKYMLETLFTNDAVETAEGAVGPEAALEFQEELSPIVKIPVFVPITEEELADVEGIRDIVDSRLTLMIKQRLNSQVVNGNGASGNLTGLVNTPNILGYVQGSGNASDNIPDAVYKAMIKVMTQGYADPTGAWFNPLDWQNVRLMKTSTGAYIYGDPSTPGPNTIFGLPVAMHVHVPAGTAVVADFAAYTKLVYRQGVEISVSDSHADYFVRGQLAIRAMMRVGFVVYRPQAACLATNLAATQ